MLENTWMKKYKKLTHALSFSPIFSHQPNRTTDNNNKSRKINIPMRAYVPSGIPMLKSVGTRAFPLAGTLVSVALHVTFKKNYETDFLLRYSNKVSDNK